MPTFTFRNHAQARPGEGLPTAPRNMAAAVLPIASLGEVIGHRRISMAGLSLFTLASLACGLAPSCRCPSPCRICMVIPRSRPVS